MDRLRQPAAEEAWERFVRLYTPFIYMWGRGAGLQTADAADLVQDVLTSLVQSLPRFWEFVVNGRPAAEIAPELDLTPNAIYLARGRVLQRLRQDLDGLLE